MSTATSHPTNRITLDNIRDVFTYHPPTPDQVVRFEAIREACIQLGTAILQNAPDCAARSRALSQLQILRMEVNASIALEPRDDGLKVCQRVTLKADGTPAEVVEVISSVLARVRFEDGSRRDVPIADLQT